MNGGFVAGVDMAGTIIVRHNEMRFAFNAILLRPYEDEDRREPLHPADIGDAPHALLDSEEDYKFNYTPPDLNRNTNVEVYGNVFEYIRDNAVEPEYGSTNWWVWNNRATNVHKAWSINNNGGGFWYFFGNVGGTDAVPPAQLNEPEEWRINNNGDVEPIRNLGGKFFKFFFGPPLPDRPCFAIHNSWRPRGEVVNEGEMRCFTHLNNAIEHCVPSSPGTDLHCQFALFAAPFDDTKPFNFGFATRIPRLNEDAANNFDHDVSTGPDFPDKPRDQGKELNGVGASRHVFDVDRRAEYILAKDSEAKGMATPITLRGSIDWPAQEDWVSTASDCGALQSDGPFRGPPFAHLSNPFYDEAPRLVAIEQTPSGIGLVFSVPLDPPLALPDPSEIAIEIADTGVFEPTGLMVMGRRILLDLNPKPDVSDVVAIQLPKGLTGGYDGVRLPIASWAAVIPITIAGGAEA